MKKTSKPKRHNKILGIYISEFVAVFVMALLSVIALSVQAKIGYISLAGTIIYIIFLIAFTQISRTKRRKRFEKNSFAHPITQLLTDLDSPVFIIKSNDQIVWSNDEFGKLSEDKYFLFESANTDGLKQAKTVSGNAKTTYGALTYAKLKTEYERYSDRIEVNVNGDYYGVKVFRLDQGNTELYGAVMYSLNEQKRLEQQISDKEVRFAYIVIDNNADVAQDDAGGRHYGSSIVNALLTQWADNVNGILTEYDRDKYTLLFENRYMPELLNSKFDIIDRVVEESLKFSPMPITISIGVSDSVGTLEDKKKSAYAALMSALQRGGAVAVVKVGVEEDTYGGRSKAAQRQTKTHARRCLELLSYEIPRSKNVIVMGHHNPDFDSIASNIGISRLVASFGVDVKIIADKNDKNISKIFSLIKNFPEYSDMFIDASYAQNLLSPEDTLVIITDASNPEQFASRDIYEKASRVIVIDHHSIVGDLGPQVLKPRHIDPTASSACELVCEILELSTGAESLRHEEALAMLAGILLDTQFFYHDTGTRTYSACIFLKNAGADFSTAQSLFRSDIDQFMTVNSIERNMEIYNDRFIIGICENEPAPENKISASKAADRLVSIEGIAASLVIYLMNDGVFLSARSDGSVNVISIAAKLGGGGHFQSAGARIKDKNGVFCSNIPTAVSLVKAAIDEYLKD